MAVIAQQARSAGNRYPQKPGTPTRAAVQTAPSKSGSPTAGGRSDESPKQNTSGHARYPSERKPSGYSRRPANSNKLDNWSPAAGGQNKPEAEILFQKYFKSVGPRTYAAQLKRAGNGNHFLVLTEAKRDEKTNELRKTRLYVYSEDFVAYFRMLHETAQFIRQNPVPEKIRMRQERRWSRKSDDVARPPATR